MGDPNVASGDNLSKAGAFEKVLVAKTNPTDATTSGNSNSTGDMSFLVDTPGRFSEGDYVSGNNIKKNTRVTGVGQISGIGTSSTIHIDRPLKGNIGAAATVSIFQAREAAADGPSGFELKAGTNITIGSSTQNAVGATVLEITASGGALDIDGLDDIDAALVDADTFPVDDGDSGTNRKATMSRLKTYMESNLSFPVTAVSNGADNRIATFSSSTALDGDADLTFDGDIFTVGNGSSYTNAQSRMFSKLTNDGAFKIAHVDTHTTSGHTTKMMDISGVYDDNTNNSTTQNLIGLKAALNVSGNHASGTKTGTGILVDVDGTTTGTTTGFGLDVDVDGFDTNYAAVFRSGSVGIGGVPDTATLLEITVPTTADNEALFLTSTHAPGSSTNITGPKLRFNANRGGGSEAGKVNDDLGILEWYGQDGGGNNQAFGQIKTRVTTITSGSETSSLQFAVATSDSGALENVLSINGGADAAGSTVQIHGNLQVDGTTTTVNSTTIELDDKNITLANGLGNDAAVNGGGITLVSTQGNKTFNWVDSTDAWTSSENLELASGKSLIIGSASMNETDLEKLDGITNGTAAASKALVVDASKDIGTLGTLTAANLTANTLVTTPSLSVDSVAVMDTGTSNSQSFSGSAVDLFTYAYGTYRTAKLVGHIHNTSTHETDAFEILVTYDGDTAPSGSGTTDVHMTTYAYISSNDTPMGTLAAVKSGSNIAIQFTNTVSNFTGAFSVAATQLIKQ